MSSSLTLAAFAWACKPSSLANSTATGARDFMASLFNTWCVQVFINVPTQTPPVYLDAFNVGSVWFVPDT